MGACMTAASQRHLNRVRELPCVVRGTSPCVAHHIRMANLTGAGQKCSDWLTIPLDPAEHELLHRDIKAWETRNGRQIDFVTQTLERLYGR